MTAASQHKESNAQRAQSTAEGDDDNTYTLAKATVPKMYAITITGIQLKNIFCYPAFYWYAIAALNAAQSAPGNIHASTNQCNMPNGVGQSRDTLMTLTVWEDRASTLQYVYKSPAHIAAMKQVKTLSNYSKTYHYESTSIPTWEEAKDLWLSHGKEYEYGTKKGNYNPDTTKNISPNAAMNGKTSSNNTVAEPLSDIVK